MPIPCSSAQARLDPRLFVARVRRALPLLLAATVLSACTIITGPDDLDREQRDLSRALRRWTSQGIADYEFVVRRDCFCAMGGVQVRVTVQNHFVVAREIDLSGVPVPSSLAYLYPSIDGLFGLVQGAIDERAAEVSARYDGSYGFPTDVWIDYDRRIADDEEGYALLRFRRLR